jgi:hypothetical protein
VRGELDRLREEHREAERSNRQGTYHRMLAVLDRLDSSAHASGLAGADYRELLEEYDYLVGGIKLFGPPEVTEALAMVQLHLSALRLAVTLRQAQHPQEEFRMAYAQAYRHRSSDLRQSIGALNEAMRADVTRGILDSREQADS